MKFFLIFSFFHMALSGALAANSANKDFDAIFFENVNFKGNFLLSYQFFYSIYINKIFFPIKASIL